MFCKDHRINMHINNGLFNNKIVYIHYTSQEGLDAIKMQRKISANPNHERRGKNAKKGVYLTFAKDALSGMDAHNLLFFGEERYRLSAMYCIVFVFNSPRYMHSAPVTSGSHITEVIALDDIYFHQINIIYEGKNPFI